MTHPKSLRPASPRLHRRYWLAPLCALSFGTLLGACGSSSPPVTPPQPTAAASAEPSPTTIPTANATAVAAAPKGTVPDASMARTAIPDRFKWKLEPIFPNVAAFEKALAEAAEGRKTLVSFKGKLKRPSELLACLEHYFQTRLTTNKLTLYGNLSADTAESSSRIQDLNQRALDSMKALIDVSSFIRQEVLTLDDGAMAGAYRREPKLVEYRPYIEELRRRRKHVLGTEAERVLALAGDNLWAEIDLNELPSDIENAYKSLRAELALPTIQDEAGKPVELNFSNFNKYRSSSDRRVRKDAVEGLLGALRKHQGSFSATLAGQFRLDVMLARARGYDSALEAYLDKDDIDPNVYRNLIRTIHANLKPLHRYVTLRKKLLGLDQVRLYDLYAPMIPAAKRNVPYAEALELLPKALAPLGSDYVAGLREGLDSNSGWIDVYPHQDKGSGAFSVSVFGLHPYVKMNYYDELDDLSTLAHEYGHALHSSLAMKHQPYVTANYVPFVAEVASTFNEKLLSDYLLANSKSPDETLHLLNELVETLRTTIYRQALFAEFELEAHTAAEGGQPLTAEFFDKLYARLVRRYYGPDFTLGPDDGMEWAYVPHFYYKYYVYSYACGLSAGIALAEKVGAGDEQARLAYLGMLGGGSSKPPLELLRGAGVDLTRPDAIEAATRLMDRTISEIEATLAAKK